MDMELIIKQNINNIINLALTLSLGDLLLLVVLLLLFFG